MVNTAAENTEDTTGVNQADQNASATQAALSGLSADEKDRIASLNYEQARDELIQTVQKLESGGLDLDQSMRQWEIGEALARRAQSLLDAVRAKLVTAQEQQASAGTAAGTQGNLER